MIIHSAEFVKSSASLKQCPESDKPEFGFIGRSNVGKSSLINLITGNSSLAKISSSPGKTRTINHFLINKDWYLVDLPGYGYAKVPSSMREKWTNSTRDYILRRVNLVCLFVLLDPRHKPQKSDLQFMEFLGEHQVPFVRIFTKSDKLSSSTLQKSISKFDEIMLQTWESIPGTFITSVVKKTGSVEILNFIRETINNLSNEV